MILHCALGMMHCQQYSIKSKKAIKLYQEAKGAQYPSDKIALLNLAIDKEPQFVEAYWELSKIYQILDSTNAAIEALQSADQLQLAMPEETKIRLSKLYYKIGEYQMALNKIAEINNPYYFSQINILKEDYAYAASLKSNPIDFKPRNLTYVNTIHDDYFPSITADGLMISTTVLSPKWMGDAPMQYQEDMYVSHWNGSKWSYSEPLPAPMNGYGNEGSQSFSADGRYMFFVQCTNRENVGSCDIWYSIRKGDKWSNPINLGEPANSRYWESNPVMSPTGDMIYFTSNRPEGLGGKDIWCVQVYIDDYGYLKTYNPQPLGKPINTDKDEFAPFIHADNHTLYFSSDKHLGMGGYDLFVSRRGANGDWSVPVNLGFPLNSSDDEMNLVVSNDAVKAFISSQRTGGRGGFDIYEFEMDDKFRPEAVEIEMISDGDYYVAAMEKGMNVTLRNIYFEFDSDELTSESEEGVNEIYDFLIEYPEIKIELVGHTDDMGSESYNQLLSERRALSVANALIGKGISAERIKTKGCGSTQPLFPNNFDDELRDLNRRVSMGFSL